MFFDGDYKLHKDVFYEIVELNDVTLSNIFSELNEKLFIEFLKCFCDIFDGENLDTFQSNVVRSRVPGVFLVHEAILMYSEDNNVYGAFFSKETSIYYFSSDEKYKKKIPKTINSWINDFEEKREIIFTSEIKKEKIDEI